MSLAKAKLKAQVFDGLGQEYVVALNAAENDSLKWDGSQVGIKSAVGAVEALMEHVKRDLKEEKVTDAQVEYARLYLRRAAEVCRNLLLKAEVQQKISKGRAQALSMVVKSLEAKKVAADRKASDLEAPEEPGEPSRRPVGSHPGNRVAALRERTVEPVSPPVEPPVNGNGNAVPQTPKKKPARKATKKKSKRSPRKKG